MRVSYRPGWNGLQSLRRFLVGALFGAVPAVEVKMRARYLGVGVATAVTLERGVCHWTLTNGLFTLHADSTAVRA